jgi:hypothetical protein
LVPTLVATIFTLVIIAPLGSVTVPVIEPVMVWAGSQAAARMSKKLSLLMVLIKTPF